MNKVTVFIEFSGEVALSVSDVWPDADEVPAHITAEAVAELMRRDGSKMQVLRDWGLNQYIDVRVAIDHGAAVEVWQ